MQRILPSLHGIAILTVILNHSVGLCLYTDQRLGIPVPAGIEYQVMVLLQTIGYIAVPIFLFSSGCFFVYSVHGKDILTSYRPVWAGLKRLVPPYIIWSIVFYILLYFLEGKAYSIPGYIKNLLVGYPYHFVPLLLVFYILAPFLILASRKYPLVLLALLGMYQLLLFGVKTPGAFGFIFPGWVSYLKPPVIASTYADWGIYFPLGIVFVQNSGVILDATPKVQKLVILFTVVFFVLLVMNELSVIFMPITRLIFPILFIFAALRIKRKNMPFASVLERVGKKSYGLYLMNIIVVNVILITFFAMIPAIFKYQLLVCILTFFLAVTIMLLLTERMENLKIAKLYQYVFG